MVPLWFPRSLGKLSHWVLPPHVTLEAILGQAEPLKGPWLPGLVCVLQVGRVGTGISPPGRDRTISRERFLRRRERVELTNSLDICLLGHKMVSQHSTPL